MRFCFPDEAPVEKIWGGKTPCSMRVGRPETEYEIGMDKRSYSIIFIKQF